VLITLDAKSKIQPDDVKSFCHWPVTGMTGCLRCKNCSKYIYHAAHFIVIVIVNSIFLQRPQKRSRGNQLIHRRLSKTKPIGSGSDPESQAGTQTVKRLWWMVFGVEMGREVGRGG